MRKSLLIYALVVGVIGLALLGALSYGRKFPVPSLDKGTALVPSHRVTAGGQETPPVSFSGSFRAHLEDPLARLLLQLIVIVLATRSLGALFSRMGQPSVIGEMAAGILLGPSLLGLLSPHAHAFIFPLESLGTLKLLSQIGVCLYLFAIGMELDLSRLRHQAHTAVVVSHASILIPYFLGVVASLWLYTHYAGPRVSFIPFALFMGIAMSITAFPVLARILEERQLAKTDLGITAITCAAVDDVTAWILLAAIVAMVHASGMAAVISTLALAAVFVGLMLLVLRPQLPRWIKTDRLELGAPSRAVVAAVILLMLFSALTTELIGIHALFGAFLAGVIMPPDDQLRRYISVRIEQFSTVFLLPLFFAFTGLRTQIALLDDLGSWGVCLALVLVATAGKLGGSMLTARLTGLNWRDAFSLGALMNTRGLMELIALNLGYDFGILSPRIFTMMVLMALITTVMTGPLLSLAEAPERRALRTLHAR